MPGLLGSFKTALITCVYVSLCVCTHALVHAHALVEFCGTLWRLEDDIMVYVSSEGQT